MINFSKETRSKIIEFLIYLPSTSIICYFVANIFVGDLKECACRLAYSCMLISFGITILSTILLILNSIDEKVWKPQRKNKARKKDIDQYNLHYEKYPELFPFIKRNIEEYEDLENEEEPFRFKVIKNNEVIEDKGFYHPNDRENYIKNNYDNDYYIYDKMLYFLWFDFSKSWVVDRDIKKAKEGIVYIDEIIKTVMYGIDDEIIFNYENCVIKYKFDKNNMTLSGEISIIDEILNKRFISRGFQEFINDVTDEMRNDYGVDLGFYSKFEIEKSFNFSGLGVKNIPAMLYFVATLNDNICDFLEQEEDRKELFVKEKVKREVKTITEGSDKNSLLKSRQM